MDTKKLRQKILDLAIHGKLVPQDPNDEPASVLLERIKAEKEQLIKEGKIKRQKKSASSDTSHYGNDVPFNVPEGWVWCQLGDVLSLISGQDFPPEKYNSLQAGIPYITGASNLVDNEIMVNRWTEYPSVISENGDLLVVCKGAGVGKMAENSIGKAHIARQIQAVRNTLHILLPKYVRIVIEYNIQNIIAQANGLIPGLKREALLALLIPIPPIEEQKRIVDEVVKWFIQIDAIEQDSSDLKDAVQKAKSKILDLALSGRLTSHTSHYGKNEEWKSARISDICTTINGLWTGKKEPFVKVGVIRNANFTKDFNLDYSKIALIDVEASSFSKRSLMTGDLIVEKSGGSDKYPVGRAVLYEGPNSQYSFSNFTMVLRPKESNVINPKYLYYFLMNRYLQGIMRTMQTQTTGLHNLILDKFMSQTVALPPIEEQAHIVESISRYFTILDSISSSC